MKLQKMLSLIVLTVAVVVGMPRVATAQLPVLLDGFSTGLYQKTLTTGFDQNVQTGSMVGGERFTTFFFCLTTTCAPQANQFGQAGSFQIRPANPIANSALIYSAGYKARPELVVIYGQSAPLNLKKVPRPAYDRLRLSFDGNTGITNFLIYAWSGNTNVSTLACHIPFNPNPFTVDLPYDNFLWKAGTGVDFSDISAMSLVFTDDDITGGNDWAITTFEAIPTGAPQGHVICDNN
jgi:hypothetical protein